MNLGGLSRPYDSRDFNLGMYQPDTLFPESYKTDISKVRKIYQNGWPACGAHAGSHFKEIQESVQDGLYREYSPKFLWNQIKKIDGFPPAMGTDIRSIMKALYTKGVCSYSLLPNNYTDNLTQYSYAPISQEMLSNALPNRIGAYAFNNYPTVDELKAAIYKNKVVIALLWIDEGFFFTNKPTFTELNKFGHFVVFYGYDSEKLYMIDSTESIEVFLEKEMPFTALKFIREIATAIDLPNQFIFKNNLYYGMKNNSDVKQLQIRLGLSPENQTGNFGPLTLAAVIKYQVANKIFPPHGFVGPLTRAKLNTNGTI